ncbi:MAG TPA: NAD(P)-dependent oxidoreductase [Candidatus Wallbacteria bacterium]|nr:NAD(P)-dependent oxidoreductase [Candidatus Wallbacteria bacterium]
MKKAIVTGANGFIGGNFVKYLISRGVSVTAVVRNEKSDISGLSGLNNVNILYCDSREINSLPGKTKDRDFDVFYHLAWDGNSGPDRQNYAMQMENVICAADAFKTSELLKCDKFLCSGTITEKVAAGILNFPDIFAQNLIYGIAKNTAHQVCEFLSRKSRVKFLWCQLSNVYGPGNKTGNIVSYTLEQIMNGKTPQFSSALQPFDLLHIDDCVTALYLLGDCNTAVKECFIGSGRPMILKEYLLQTGRAVGADIAEGIGRRPDDGIVYDIAWFSIDKLIKETKFIPKISFEEGIIKTIESMKSKEMK